MEQSDKYYQLVEQAILRDRDFGIKEVRQLEKVYASHFDKELYPIIVARFKTSSNHPLPQCVSKEDSFREYLEIYKFVDQSNTEYFVMIYDSDHLWQDPEIIDLIPVS